MTTTDVEPRPIGGWLFLIGLGVVLNPFILTYNVYQTYWPVFSQNVFSELMDRSGDVYQPLLGGIILIEVFVNICLILLWSFALYAFWTRKLVFPKTYIFLVIFQIAFLIVDGFAVSYVLDLQADQQSGVFDEATLQAIVRSFFSACIWVPYLLISVRVKETFLFKLNGDLAGRDSLQDVFD